jgi:CHASE2 domain-containing sensor protein
MKTGFWKKDWFLGLVVSLVLLFMGGSQVIQSLERSAYDWGVRASSRTPSDRVVVIAIDDASIRNIGRWPWSRQVHAKMTENLANAKAKVVANLVFFSEPQIDPGFTYIQKMLEAFGRSYPEGANPPGDIGTIGGLLREAEQDLNTDRKLSDSYAKAGNVMLPMLFELGIPQGKPDKALPEYVAKNAVQGSGSSDERPLPTRSVISLPIDEIGKAAAGLGHLNANVDVDGGIRTEALVLQHFDQVFPSLALMVAAKSVNLAPSDIKVTFGEGVTLQSRKIATDPSLQMYTYFYKDRDGQPAFRVDSFFDVYSGKVPYENFRDKIVLIGPTAAGVGTTSVTPISPAMAPVMTLAHGVSSILQEHFFVAPTWGFWVEKLVFLLVAAYLIALAPRLKAGLAFGITGGIAVFLLAAHFLLMTGSGMWLQFMQPLVLLVIGHALLTTKRFVMTEAGKVKSDQESAASNRMLGLAFQGQGQLDMAFDYFRKCPMEDAVMDNLYNLALDFERKRQFNKAESVFRYMSDFNPKFRDLEQRLSRAKQLSETVILGGGSGGRTNASILGEGGSSVEKPMLGRYQVEKELGKGAMGVVYLGKDPKIGRVVAIKTMALSQEFEAEELIEVKERFFREAETAGRLSHPNIVTIYDAGEEHDLCFIAMELLKGKDLVPYVKQGALLPIDKVVSIHARVADALGYAHKQNVVHRDIKPANIMYELESDVVKVTDFGIARITDSSKTKTGMVLGTPSYMSPEQLSGKKVDGRSDLFSLAVSLYQMLCGKLPFEGDSMAQLMFRIANEQAPDILTINPSLPPGLVAFLDRAMAKEADERYQTGDEFATALRAAMGAGPSGAPASADVDISL